MNRNVALAQIADVYARSGALLKNYNSTFEAVLKCADLSTYWNEYCAFLIPYEFVQKNGKTYQNQSNRFDVFSGLNGLFERLTFEDKNEAIVHLLSELAKRISPIWANDEKEDFDRLSRLYELLGLSLSMDRNDRIQVDVFSGDSVNYLSEKRSLEEWLNRMHPEVMKSYQASIIAYKEGHVGTCIEACRTTLTTLLEHYKGTESFAKWIRGFYNISGECSIASTDELTNALKRDLNKDDLADFFLENRCGRLTKTKAIYCIYSMLSDYGTHRGEGAIEAPSLNDALLSFRFVESIMLWVFMTKK